jgi:hypothetical protein
MVARFEAVPQLDATLMSSYSSLNLEDLEAEPPAPALAMRSYEDICPQI